MLSILFFSATRVHLFLFIQFVKIRVAIDYAVTQIAMIYQTNNRDLTLLEQKKLQWAREKGSCLLVAIRVSIICSPRVFSIT